ncbi:hypothetical protein LXL04_019762 [Taraxacum kok-saghyz]
MSFEIGESVKVIGNEDGMDGTYFAGKVIDRSPGRENNQVSYPKAKISIHQDWKALETEGKWKYIKR